MAWWSLARRGIPDPAAATPGDVLTVQGDNTLDYNTPTGGGSPTGSAGGALDGSYPNPGLNASVAGAGLSESSDVLAVNVDGSTLEISADSLRVKDGGITIPKLSFDPATQAELDAAAATILASTQPLDSDLTAIAALSTTSFGRSLLELANAGALRTAAGLGTAATSNTGDFDAAGAAAAAQAASQPLDSDLTAIAALTTTSYGRSLLEAANAGALRTLAGLVPGTDVQAFDAELAAIAGLTSAADKLPYFTGSGTAALADLSSFIRTLLDDANAATALGTLGAAASARTLTAGAALTGGGDLSADRTFDVAVDGSTIEVSSDALRVKALGITDAHIAAANKDGASGTASMRTLGTGAAQAAAGNDSRLSDSRAPSGSAGGALDGSYPNPGLAAAVAGAGLAETSDVLSVNVDGSTIEINSDTLRIKAGGVTGNEIAAAIKDAAAATASLRTLGTGAAQAAAGNDSRLSDSRAPSGAAGGELAGTFPNPTIGQAYKARNRRGASVVTSVIAESCDRSAVSLNNAILASARLQPQLVPVLSGDVITNVSFWQGATAFTAATNAWMAIADSALNVIRQSTDQLTAGITSNTLKTLAVDSIPVTAGSRSGTTTVTLTFPTLSEALTSLIAVSDSITVSNANIAAYNGTFTVVSVSSTQITYVCGSSATDSLAAPFPTVRLAAGKRTYTVPSDGYLYACLMLKGTIGTQFGPNMQAIAIQSAPIFCGAGQTALTGTCPSPITVGAAGTLCLYAALS